MGTLLDEVVQEILDHQGLSYDVVTGQPPGGTKYPVVLVSVESEATEDVARQIVTREGNVVVVDQVMNLSEIHAFLAGKEWPKEDAFEPLVNNEEERLVGIISERLASLGLKLRRRDFWPGGAPACCVLTHDVDWLHYSPFHKAALESGHGLKSLFRLLFGGLKGKDYGWNIDTIIGLERRNGFRSTFFLMTRYAEEKDRLVQAIALLKDAEFEIGLHGANKSHMNRESLHKELLSFEKMAGRPAGGLRHHILKFNVPGTWEYASQERLSYDATFSANRLFGFRARVCLPYHPFDGTGRIQILEIPTSFMDFTALARGLRGERAMEVLKKLAEKVEEHHGVLALNFHNTYLNRETFPDVCRLYESFLAMVKERGYWVATAQECASWWNSRSAFRPGPQKLETATARVIGSPVALPDERHPAFPKTKRE